MKKYILLFTILTAGILSSCKDWLTVYPDDEIASGDLFKDGEGFRTALNGIYQQLSGKELYGQNLTYGVVEAMGQMYDKAYLNSGTNNPVFYASDLDYKRFSTTINNVWSKMYNSIANCNNLIQEIEKVDSNIFEYKNQEKVMITGEAYALRGFMHFDLLRLFAPSVAEDNGQKYIPYSSTYPSIMSERKSVQEVLELVVKDLLTARKLAAQDTLPENVRAINTEYNRIDNGGWGDGNRGTFWRMRGTHMNYHNITALLARVYLYAGNLEKAHEYASEVLAFPGSNSWTPAYKYPSSWEYSGNRKSKGDVLLAFFNGQVTDYHTSFFNDDSYGFLAIRHHDLLFSDKTDDRYSQMTAEPKTGMRISTKYQREESESNERVNGPLIPVMRMGEMVYIVSEYMARKGDIEGASNFIHTNLRQKRGCINPLPPVSELNDFLTEMALDARRELVEEGQMFFMYKRLNTPIWDGERNKINMAGKWVWDIPSSENL